MVSLVFCWLVLKLVFPNWVRFVQDCSVAGAYLNLRDNLCELGLGEVPELVVG